MNNIITIVMYRELTVARQTDIQTDRQTESLIEELRS